MSVPLTDPCQADYPAIRSWLAKNRMQFDQMKRREFMTLLGGVAAAWPFAARAQQPTMPVVGVMSPLSVATAARNLSSLRNGLRDLGYSEGRSVKIEARFADGVAERFPVLVADLLALKPAVLLVGSTAAILAARRVTRTIPLIWFGTATDPVALGLADSFARPGGNVTGFLLSSDARMVGKRLELLREVVPKFTEVGFVIDPDYAAADGTLHVIQPAARALGLDARVYEVRSGAELQAAFAAAVRDSVQALYVPEAPLLLTRRAEIAELATTMRLPAIYTFREYVQSGGLMSYGSDLPDLYRRAATYVDKILKGAKPGELPLQTAEKFELAVNLKTAKVLGLTISEAFLVRADDVIE
jgi:putative tryptophan/tyrosine transport system substrate-binding protein